MIKWASEMFVAMNLSPLRENSAEGRPPSVRFSLIEATSKLGVAGVCGPVGDETTKTPRTTRSTHFNEFRVVPPFVYLDGVQGRSVERSARIPPPSTALRRLSH
jgi:hypothetical protein